jgi:hypothetical protein
MRLVGEWTEGLRHVAAARCAHRAAPPGPSVPAPDTARSTRLRLAARSLTGRPTPTQDRGGEPVLGVATGAWGRPPGRQEEAGPGGSGAWRTRSGRSAKRGRPPAVPGPRRRHDRDASERVLRRSTPGGRWASPEDIGVASTNTWAPPRDMRPTEPGPSRGRRSAPAARWRMCGKTKKRSGMMASRPTVQSTRAASASRCHEGQTWTLDHGQLDCPSDPVMIAAIYARPSADQTGVADDARSVTLAPRMAAV